MPDASRDAENEIKMKKATPAREIKHKPQKDDSKSLRVLLIEDNEDDALLVLRELKKGGFNLVYERVETAAAMKKALKEGQWDIILSDYKLPKFDGIQAINLLRETQLDIPLILVSGTIGEETAVECMRAGAVDYVMKNNLTRLCQAIKRELKEAQTRNRRRQAEEVIRESEGRYRTILDEMDDAYFEIDLAGNFTFVNDTVCRALGYSREKLLTMNFRAQIAKEDIEHVYNIFGKIYRTGNPEKNFLYKFVNKDGALRFAETSAFPLQNQKGKAIGFRGIGRDITESKKAEDALRERSRELDNLMSSLPGMVYRCANDREWTMFFISEGCLALTGYNPEDLLNNKKRSFNDLVMPEYRENLWQKWQELLAERATFEDEYPIRTAGGDIKWVWERGRGVYDTDGQLLFLEGYIEDISASKKAQLTLRNNEENFRRSIDDSPLGVRISTKQAETVYANKVILDIYGYKSLEEFKNTPVKDRYTPQSYSAYLLRSKERKQGKLGPSEYEISIIRKNGEVRHLRAFRKEILWNGEKQAQIIYMDITEQKQAQEKLQQSEENFRLTFNSTSDVIFTLDTQLRLHEITPSVEKVLGYKAEELTGKSLPSLNIMSPESREKASLQAKKILSGKYAPPAVYEFILKDGRKGFGEITASPIIKDNKIIGVTCVSRDITERLKAEAERQGALVALRESEEKYRTILENIEDGYYEVDMAGNLTFFNDSVCRIAGYNREELMGMNYQQYTIPENIKEILKTFNQVYTTGIPAKGFDWKIINKDGEKRFFEASVSLMKDVSNKPIGFRGIIRDITENKKAQEKLRQSEENYRSLFDNAKEGILIAQNGKISFANPALVEILGYPIDTIKNKPFTSFIHPEDSKRVFDNHQKRLRGEDAETNYDFRVITGDGAEKWLLIKSQIISWNGLPSSLSFIEDITERKKVEDALRESEEKYRLIFEHSPIGLLYFDINGVIVACNDNFVKIIGSSREALIGLNMLNLPDKGVVSAVRQALSGSAGFYEDMYHSVTAPKITPIRALFTPMNEEGGIVQGGVGIIEDVTQQKKAQEAIKQSEEKYRSLVENAQEGVYQTSAEGKFITVNNGFARILGYNSAPEILQAVTNIADQLYVYPRDRERLLNIVKKYGAVTNFESQLYRKDGSHIWVSISSSAALDDQKRVLYYQGMVQDISEKKQLEVERAENVKTLRKALGATISAMAVMVETRDPYTAGHQRRVADLARAIATEMRLPSDRIDGVRMAGMLHDIGKISIPSEILTKPTQLTALEFNLIKTHPDSGYAILKDIEFPWPIARIVLEHHERVNGSGYPSKLKENEILLESKIMSVADVVEAISSNRPYRPSKGLEVALEEITKNKGVLYDEKVVDACLRLFREKSYTLAA
jgi:PAS domain S-box-containing protein/putative nucleotidyltransferase with HDIG domain